MYFTISVHLNDGRGGLIRGIASLEGDNLVVHMYFIISVHLNDERGGLIRGIASLEGDNLVVHMYFTISQERLSLL
jgi:hypothetical protein